MSSARRSKLLEARRFASASLRALTEAMKDADFDLATDEAKQSSKRSLDFLNEAIDNLEDEDV